MNKCIKKPIEIECIQWDGTKETWDKIIASGCDWSPGEMGSDSFYINHMAGSLLCKKGHYLIRGPLGEFYSVTPEHFKEFYEEVEPKAKNLTFGEATHGAKYLGKKVRRAGWNNPNQYIYFVQAQLLRTVTDIAKKEFGEFVRYRAYWALKTAQGDVATWQPTVSDTLEEDWEFID